MKKLLTLFVAGLALCLAAASPAAAHEFRCSGTLTGVTVRDVVVPPGGSCTLVNSRVRGSVSAFKDSYFEATNTRVRRNVKAYKAETLFINGSSVVKGSINAYDTSQVFLFDSSARKGIDVERATDKVNVCGMTVDKGEIEVRGSGRDILVGDPLALACAGNTVRRGELEIKDNYTDVELVVRGNIVSHANLEVIRNTGPSDKFVQNNSGKRTLDCRGNTGPFVGSPNPGFTKTTGQCGH